MPQKGEIRRGATESGQWDGSQWIPLEASKPASVDNPRSFGWLDAVPGLRDALNIPENLVKGAQALPDVARGLVHEPGATLKGFAQGTSEAATPGRVGLLALLTGGATVPAALAAAGGESIAQGTRVATDAPNAPQSFPEAAGNVLEAAAVPGVAAGLKAVPGAVESMGGTRKVAGRVLGAGLGGYEGYKYGGISGAIAGAAGGGALGGGSLKMRALRSVLGGGAAEDVATGQAETAPSGFAQQPRTSTISRPDAPYRGSANTQAYWPERETAWDKPIEDPRDPPFVARSPEYADTEPVSPSMAGLNQAVQMPASWSKLPTDAEMDADIIARNATGKWKR